jgi:hypothetical protein
VYSKTNLVYGRIVNYNDDLFTGEPQLTINLFAPFQQTCLVHKLLFSPPANLEFIPEFVQTTSMIEVPLKQIHDICFLFSLKDVFSGIVFCEGIHNAFFVRFRSELDTNENYEAVDINNHYYCFPSLSPMYRQYGTCYIKRIWNCVSCIQDAMFKLLSIRSFTQALFPPRMHTISIDVEQWQYIYDHCCELSNPLIVNKS